MASEPQKVQPGKLAKEINMIVGLGNPGEKYDKTRHNAGFWFLDEVARRYGAQFRTETKFSGLIATIRVNGRDIRLLKPTTFMNNSGRSVSALAKFYKIQRDQILVAHDELDLPCGVARLKASGGHGGHNGLRDIISAMGGKDFWRLRIGIDHPGDKNQVTDYVLKQPGKADRQKIDNSLMDTDRVLENVLSGEMEVAMKNLHTNK